MKVFGKRTGLVVGLSTVVAAALMAQTYQQTTQSQQTQQSGNSSASASSSASARSGGGYSGSQSAQAGGSYQGSQSGRGGGSGSGSGSGSSISNMIKNARGTTFVIDYMQTGDTDGQTTRQAMRAHNAYLKSYADAHTLILAGQCPEDNTELAILIAPSLDGAKSFADSDPAVQAGVLKTRVRTLNLTQDGTGGQMAAPSVGVANPSGLGAHDKKNHP